MPGVLPQAQPSPALGNAMYLLERRCSLLFMHLRRQQVRKATDMSRMMAQLTMEAITATLKPRDSCSGMAGKEIPSSSWGAARLSLVLSKPTPRGDQEALAAEAGVCGNYI